MPHFSRASYIKGIYLMLLLVLLSLMAQLPHIDGSEGRLFAEVPKVDLVVMTPMWPTYCGGAESFNFENIAPGGVASDGHRLYVSDTLNDRVIIFDLRSLKPIGVIGQRDLHSRIPGCGPYDLNYPLGIDTDGRWLFIADRGNSRLVIYDLKVIEPILVILPPPYDGLCDLAWDGRWLYATVTGATNAIVVFTNITKILQGDLRGIEPDELIILGEWGFPGGDHREPAGIDVDDEYLYVSDRYNREALIWRKSNIEEGAPPDYVLKPCGYDVASNDRYIFLGDDQWGRVLVFDKGKLRSGAEPDFVIGRGGIKDEFIIQVPSRRLLAVPRGLYATEDLLLVADKNFYLPSILIYNVTEMRSGLEAEALIGVFWPRNPKYGFEIVGDMLFVGGQEYIGVFNHLPNESYSYPDGYLGEILGSGMGGVSVSSDGRCLCIIEKGDV